MKRKVFTAMLAVTVVTLGVFAEPKVSFSGYLDSDVWTDFDGNFYTNDELDLGMSVAFSDKVSANVYMTIIGGAIPAGSGGPGTRWVSVLFDGVDITFDSKIGSFSVGDLVYQYGGFNYYLYKRGSMITFENFTRGVQYSVGNDKIIQTIIVGAADKANELVSLGSTGSVVTVAGDTVSLGDTYATVESNIADIGGSTKLGVTDDFGLSVFYGMRTDVKAGFETTGSIYAGLEFAGAIGEALELKVDIGMQNFVNDNAATADVERSTTVPILLEPSLGVGNFSTALSFYYVVDGDKTGEYMTPGEQMFAYLEPGLAFNDYLAAGLPLELHSMGMASNLGDNGEFWVVPTFYIYPIGGVEWWVWFQFAKPFANGSDPYMGLGSELIIEF